VGPNRRATAWVNRNVIAMCLTSLLSDWGHEMATAALPGFIAILGLGALSLGAIEGIADGVSSFMKLWAGPLSDRLPNRKPIVTSGYAITGASKALFALAHGWPLILVGRVTAWFGRGIRGPARDAMLAESVPAAQVGRAFGFHRAGDTIGAVVGPLAALGLLALLTPADASYRTLFVWTLVAQQYDWHVQQSRVPLNLTV
jgi:MFS family permease